MFRALLISHNSQSALIFLHRSPILPLFTQFFLPFFLCLLNEGRFRLRLRFFHPLPRRGEIYVRSFPFRAASSSFPLSGRNIAKPARNVHICAYIYTYVCAKNIYIFHETFPRGRVTDLDHVRSLVDSFLSRSETKNRGGGSFEDKPSKEGGEGGWFDRRRKREEDSWSFAKVNRYWKFNYRARPLAAFVIFNERVLRRDGKRETNPSGWLLTDGI